MRRIGVYTEIGKYSARAQYGCGCEIVVVVGSAWVQSSYCAQQKMSIDKVLNELRFDEWAK